MDSRPPIPLLFLIGLPGGGKSTLARSLLTPNSCPELHQKLIGSRYAALLETVLGQSQLPKLVISTDAIRADLFGAESIQGNWSLIEAALQQQFQQAIVAISQQQAAIALYDATNAVRKHRRQMLCRVRSVGFFPIVGLWLQVPLSICLLRNADRSRQVPEPVIHRMARRLSAAPPALADGFDDLIELDSQIEIDRD